MRSFHVPATFGTSACAPSLPSTPTVRATLVTCCAKMPSVSVIELSVSASAAISPFASTTSFCLRSPVATAVTTFTMPRTCVVRFVAMKLTLSVRSFHTPDTPRTFCLAAELALGADLLGDARDLGGEGVELIDHRVDGVLELEHLALGVDGDLLRQVALRHRRRDLGDVAHLVREVRREDVDVVGEVLPRAAHTLDLGLTAELALGADLFRDAGDLAGEGAELIDHRVDGVLELVDLALGVDGDLARHVAVGDGGRHLGDVADLRGEVVGEQVDVVGERPSTCRPRRAPRPARRACPPRRRFGRRS